VVGLLVSPALKGSSNHRPTNSGEKPPNTPDQSQPYLRKAFGACT